MNKKNKLRESFLRNWDLYQDSNKYRKRETKKIKRFFYFLNKFGLSYVWYQLSRLKFLSFLGGFKVKLFFGKNIKLPFGDVGSGVFCMYGILPHKSERKLTLWLINNIKERDVFYDVGAHMGFYTGLTSYLVGERGHVLSFEANSKLCKYLKINFKNKKTKIFCGAVSDQIGRVDFYDASVAEDSSASSRFPLHNKKIYPIKVVSTTIDETSRLMGCYPTVIKFDIEGGEYDALLGAEKTIKDHKPKIIMEVWGGEQGQKYSSKAINFLKDKGYQAFLINNEGFSEECLIDNVVFAISKKSKDNRDNVLFMYK